MHNNNYKRKRNDFIEDINYDNYLKQNNESLNINHFFKYKTIGLSNYIANNDIVKLSENNYLCNDELKFKPDCFTNTGDLVDIFVSSRKSDEVKLNVIPESYINYIQFILNKFNIKKCIIKIYHFVEYDNSREMRRNNKNLSENDYGFFINDKDVYWVIEHERNIICNKRKITNSSKRYKKDKFLNDDWIGASKTRNYALGDPCLDYYRAYNILDINDKPKKNAYSFDPSSKYERTNREKENALSFIDYLLISGNNFEDKIVESMLEKYEDNMIKICESYQSRNMKYYEKTLESMKEGIPIIYQAVIYNFENKTFGSADLVVRSDYINEITETNVLTKREEKIKAPLLGKYHYRVIDIKNSKLHMNTDNETIRNTQNIKPFKTQLAIYNKALGNMQGYTPDHSYILGNGWLMTKSLNKQRIVEGSDNPFDKLGIVNHEDQDKIYYEVADEAVNWIKEVKTNDKLVHNPPNDDRLYPNMCNYFDGIYHDVKRQIANQNSEITNVWYCGKTNRENALKLGINSWKDPKCNSKTLGLTGDKIKNKVDEILTFNRNKKKVINITRIKHNKNNWRNNELTLFVDFETISSNLLLSNNKSDLKMDGEYIFMIGIGWIEPNDEKWNYKCLYTDKIDLSEERRIVNEFKDIVSDLNSKFKTNSKIVHWSNAEPIMFNKICNRHSINSSVNWFDLLHFFKENNILILDALNFSLKTIAKSMYKYGMIKTVWDDDISNGLDAMFFAWQEYIKLDDISESKKFKDIIKYNEVDCKTTFEILQYLKINH